ncbi:hypothetical protein [Massilia sp. TS11]|uniref:hypothetical protein n=1 Tax=Massilia sp. TS11 TaxID=2908003 RepID=UPI001EDB14DF|nr:hypothetical protein [Massilia sp. TS11]MCG2585345.1 hypothetical protein [Massilia sp. TS11]
MALLPLFSMLCLPLALGLSAAGPAAPAPLTLALHAQATLAPAQLLTLDSVQDSRCPQGAQCIQQGQLIYQLRLRVGDSEIPFSLSRANPSVSAAGWQFTLDPEREPERIRLHAPAPAYFIVLHLRPAP